MDCSYLCIDRGLRERARAFVYVCAHQPRVSASIFELLNAKDKTINLEVFETSKVTKCHAGRRRRLVCLNQTFKLLRNRKPFAEKQTHARCPLFQHIDHLLYGRFLLVAQLIGVHRQR